MRRFDKLVSVLFLVLMIVGTSSCSDSKDKGNVVSTVTETTSETTETIDIDLSSLSSTMAYSQLTDMLNNTNKYLWKKVKIKGSFGVYEPGDGNNFYACLLYDTSACCSLALEFIPSENMKYPDDFPAVGDEITVEGEFTTYEDAGTIYATLKDAEFVK